MYRKLPEGDVPPRSYLGALGMTTGLTAYAGMIKVGQVAEGDTVVVSAAAGAVGTIACQLAKIAGARVIGIAGGPAKVTYLVDEIGCDAAIDYKNDDIAEKLKELAPDGVNVFFDNVGGEILDICLDRIALNARVVLCGGISRYNVEGELPGPKNYFNLIFRRARMPGFLAPDYAPRFDEAYAELQGWLAEGKIKQRETVIEGFDNLPRALVLLFQGANTGKMMVKV